MVQRSEGCLSGGQDLLDPGIRVPALAEQASADELEQWLRRFVDAGLQIFPDEVVVKGIPWRMTVCIRGTVSLHTSSGQPVYENRSVTWGRMAWGLLREYEVYEDTQQTESLDAYLGGSA